MTQDPEIRIVCDKCGKPEATFVDSGAFDEVRMGAEPPVDWADFEGNNLCWIEVTSMCSPTLQDEDYIYRISRILGFREICSLQELWEKLSEGKPIGR